MKYMVTITSDKNRAAGRLRNEIKRELEALAAKKKRSCLSGKNRTWRKKVLARDGGKCTVCGSSESLHAHHIKSVSEHSDLEFNIDNGVTLCKQCHSNEHKHLSSFILSAVPCSYQQVYPQVS